jgi:hypothetical protein
MRRRNIELDIEIRKWVGHCTNTPSMAVGWMAGFLGQFSKHIYLEKYPIEKKFLLSQFTGLALLTLYSLDLTPTLTPTLILILILTLKTHTHP